MLRLAGMNMSLPNRLKPRFRYHRLVERVALAVILLLAFALRLHRLDAQSIWYDEAVTAQVAGQGLAELTRWTAGDIQPPLYYYIVSGWTHLIGAGVTGTTPGGEWALRFPSATFGMLGVALIWGVARRLFRALQGGRPAALMAALLMTVSPLQVYYGQEARMYTLLTSLALLVEYTLLAALGQGIRGPQIETVNQVEAGGRTLQHPFIRFYPLRCRTCRKWLAFVLAGTALLYTHYFGAFLLLALGLCWAIAVLGGGAAQKRTVLRGLLAFAAIALLYLPWLPAMLGRYQDDRSYWQGALKLGEALRHVALSFTTGAPETMLESDALRLLPWFGLALLVAVVALLWQARATRARSIAWVLLAVLLLPTLAVLLLASRSPKFNPRYLMLVSPAYLLLLAGGVAALWHAPRRFGALRLAPAVLLVALVAVSGIGLRNWFSNPAFTKAQWRELAAYIHADKAPDDAVLLVSGHAYPAWNYYAPDIAPVRLPAIDILDVQAVIGFEVGPQLTEALAGRSGAWLVSWQNEVMDPVGFAPYYLDRGGQELPVDRRFWHLGLRRWQLDPGATYPAEPQPQHSDGANFDHKLALLGWDDVQVSAEGAMLTLYWRVLNTLTADYQLSIVVEDAAGRELGRWDGRPAGYDYPTTRWQPGQALFGRVPLPVEALRGEVYLTVAVYDAVDPSGLDIRDAADNPAGKRVRLGPIAF